MKQAYKKLLTIVLWFIAIAGLTMCLGFASEEEARVQVKDLDVEITNSEENPFLTESDVKNFFSSRNDKVLQQEYGALNITGLEKALSSHPAIRNAEVSRDIYGGLKVHITQRTPVLRILNKSGESYYLDEDARVMPLSENYTARVMVANGEINEPYNRRYEFTADQIAESKVFSEVSILDDLMSVTRHIRSDTVLSSLIHQVYVNGEKELELFPAIGGHRIIFGKAEDVAVKFNKLKLFYAEAMNRSDGWEKYSTINLKYRNLVVCTKK